jgi:hypothetical protein
MWRRIFGGLLFLWMAAATIGASLQLRDKHGTPFWTGVGAAVFCGSLAAIGLKMVFHKAKANKDPQEPHPHDHP